LIKNNKKHAKYNLQLLQLRALTFEDETEVADRDSHIESRVFGDLVVDAG